MHKRPTWNICDPCLCRVNELSSASMRRNSILCIVWTPTMDGIIRIYQIMDYRNINNPRNKKMISNDVDVSQWFFTRRSVSYITLCLLNCRGVTLCTNGKLPKRLIKKHCTLLGQVFHIVRNPCDVIFREH